MPGADRIPKYIIHCGTNTSKFLFRTSEKFTTQAVSFFF